MKCLLGKLAACLLFVAAGTTQAFASSVAPLTNEEVLATADSVFIGTVIASEARATGPRGQIIVTDYQIRVDRLLVDDGSIARDQHAGVVTLTFAGGTIGELGMDVSGIPRLNAGDRAFFFVEAPARRSFSPLVGLYQGLYRIRTINGAERVTHEDACCTGGDGVVRMPLMSKLAPAAGNGFTADEFAAQITAALPKVRELPALRHTAPPTLDPALRGKAFQGSDLPQLSVGGPVAKGTASEAVRMAPAPMQIRPQEVMMLAPSADDRTELETSSPYEARYGFFRAVPNLPIVYNIPPVLYPTWGNAFEETLSYWNFYASDIFRKYTTSNNSLTANNGRNEFGFLDNAAMVSVYNYPWGASTYAVNLSWSVSNRIVESDILFNPAWAWTVDRETAYQNSNVVYFQPVSLHEQGHSFGRDHSWITNPNYGAPSAMNYWTRPFYLTETYRVFADDAESIRAAYPSRATPRNDALLTMWRMAGVSGSNYNDVTDLYFSPSSVQQGNSFTIYNMYAENVGTVQRDISVDFWLCPTQRNFTGAYYAGTSYVGNFPRFTIGSFNRTITVPSNVPPGSYYVCAALSGGDDSNFNSQAWAKDRISVYAPPPPPPPSNDRRVNATWIVQGTYYGNTTYATVDGSADCGFSNGTPDIWYRISMPYSGGLDVDTCGSSFDTVASLEYWWGGHAACDDDAATCGGNHSDVSAHFNSGDTVYIRISGYNGYKGSVQITARVIPDNDACSAAVPVAAGTSYGTNVGATSSGIAASCFSATTPDIWYSYTSSCSGQVTIDTVGSNFDTLLATYSFCGGNSIQCNDDSSGTLQSRVSYFANAGETTLIRVGGYNLATGNVVLNVTAPSVSNDVCETASAIGDGAVGFDTRCATTQGVDVSDACGLGSTPLINDIWYSYTAPISGVASISFCGDDFDTAVTVYDASLGCPANSDSQIVCAVMTESCPANPAVVFNASAGSSYLVRVGGYYGGPTGLASGTGGFAISTLPSAPTNDACEAATQLTNSPATFTFEGTLVAATHDGTSTLDPIDGSGVADVWLAWDAPCDGQLVISTCGTYGLSGTNTILSLHTGCPGDLNNEIAAATTSSGIACGLPDDFDAEIVTYVSAGAHRLIRIAAEDLQQPLGLITCRLSFSPQGDTFTSPRFAYEGSNSFCTYGATADDIGDPFGLNDIWHLYQPTCSGTATVSLCATGDDTALAVYTFDAVNYVVGTPLVYNDNDGPVCAGIAASATFDCTAGEYYIIRTGIAYDALLTLDVSCSPAAAPCPADFNQDGGVDGADVDAFFAAWESGDASADVNQDGGVDGSDVDVFFAAWEAGGC